MILKETLEKDKVYARIYLPDGEVISGTVKNFMESDTGSGIVTLLLDDGIAYSTAMSNVLLYQSMEEEQQ